MGSFSTDDTADGHEKPRHQRGFWSAYHTQVRGKAFLSEKMEIPESGARAQHILAEGTHHTVRTCAVLEDGHRSYK